MLRSWFLSSEETQQIPIHTSEDEAVRMFRYIIQLGEFTRGQVICICAKVCELYTCNIVPELNLMVGVVFVQFPIALSGKL